MGKNDNALEKLGPYEDNKSTLKEQNIERDHRNLMNKTLDSANQAKDGLLKRTFQNKFLASELPVFLREVRFNKQEFPADKLVLYIKYLYLGFQNDNHFHWFNLQLDYALTTYFAESKTIKGNIDRFFSNLLIAPLIEKLSY